jgi:hypothetical protein
VNQHSNGPINDLAVAAAHQNAMERSCVFLPHGSRLFEVEQGWESAAIRADKKTAIADTLLSFEEALRDTERAVIFIPLDALIGSGDIEKLCQRNAITKTILKEVAKS